MEVGIDFIVDWGGRERVIGHDGDDSITVAGGNSKNKGYQMTRKMAMELNCPIGLARYSSIGCCNHVSAENPYCRSWRGICRICVGQILKYQQCTVGFVG